MILISNWYEKNQQKKPKKIKHFKNQVFYLKYGISPNYLGKKIVKNIFFTFSMHHAI